MSVHTLSLGGLEDADVAVFTRVFGRLRNKLDADWRLANVDDASLTVVDIDSIAGHMNWLTIVGGGHRAVVYTDAQYTNESDLVLFKPLTPHSLVELLNAVTTEASGEPTSAPEAADEAEIEAVDAPSADPLAAASDAARPIFEAEPELAAQFESGEAIELQSAADALADAEDFGLPGITGSADGADVLGGLDDDVDTAAGDAVAAAVDVAGEIAAEAPPVAASEPVMPPAPRAPVAPPVAKPPVAPVARRPVAPPPAVAAPAPAPAPAPVPAPTVVSDAAPKPAAPRSATASVGDALRDGGVRVPMCLRVGDDLWVIDPDRDAYHGPAHLKPLHEIMTGPRDRLEAADVGTLEQARRTPAHPLARLRWYAGLLATPGRLHPGLASDGRYQLTRWPQIEREFPRHFRVATAMMKEPGTVADIAAASGVPAADVADFINAADAIGIIASGGDRSGPDESSRGGVMSRIRRPFGR